MHVRMRTHTHTRIQAYIVYYIHPRHTLQTQEVLTERLASCNFTTKAGGGATPLNLTAVGASGGMFVVVIGLSEEETTLNTHQQLIKNKTPLHRDIAPILLRLSNEKISILYPF